MTQPDHRGSREGRRRGNRGAAVLVPLVLGLAVFGLAACTTETVTPAVAAAAYVALGSGVANPGSTVDIVDTATGNLGRPITVGTLPSAVALLPGAKDLLVTVKAQDQLVEVSTSSGKVVKRIGVGLEPDAVAVTPDGALAFVADFGDNTVTSVHLGPFTVGATVTVGRQPVAIAVTPDGTRALVANYEDGTVTPISLPGLTAGAPIPVGPEPSAVFIASDGTTALVAGFETSSVIAIALPSLAAGRTVPVGANPTGIAAAAGSPVAWVSAGDGITPVAIATLQVGNPISIGTPSECLAIAPGGDPWVCNGDGALVEVNPATATPVRTVNLHGLPAAVAISGAA
jgi:DNA-binding beta-propeller fold protein YncE